MGGAVKGAELVLSQGLSGNEQFQFGRFAVGVDVVVVDVAAGHFLVLGDEFLGSVVEVVLPDHDDG